MAGYKGRWAWRRVASDAELALAFVARRQGRGSLPASQWAHVLSLELGWSTPSQARAFVARAQESGLLVEEGDALRLAVDWKRVEVPRKFRLDPEAPIEVRAPRPDDPFVGWLDAVAKAQSSDRSAVLAAVADKQARFGGALSAEAALLLVAAEAGLEVREEAAAALDRLKRRA